LPAVFGSLPNTIFVGKLAADESRLAACAPRNRRIFCLTLNVALALQSN